MRAPMRFALSAGFIVFVVGAIAYTPTGSRWLLLWFPLFFFLAIPLLLLAIRDLVVHLKAPRDKRAGVWMLLHVCAVFALATGALLAWMARSSGHPQADQHLWLMLALPALVYLTPVLLALQSFRFDLLKILLGARQVRSRAASEHDAKP